MFVKLAENIEFSWLDEHMEWNWQLGIGYDLGWHKEVEYSVTVDSEHVCYI